MQRSVWVGLAGQIPSFPPLLNLIGQHHCL